MPRRIYWHATIGSTMHEAIRLANEGAPSGTVVAADEQTQGHGRYGRIWHSEARTGLYFSIILRLPLNPAELPAVTLALGLAVAQAIHSTTGIACDLRWPNDVLIADRKCAGILTQLHDGAIVAGIGINVNQSSFPTDVESIATSLRLAGGREQSREVVLEAVLEEIDRHCEILSHQGPAAIFTLFTQMSTYVAGRRVIVDLPGGTVTGTTAGLTQQGFLRLCQDGGREEIVVAGGVRPCS